MYRSYKPLQRTIQPLPLMIDMQISKERGQNKSPNSSEKEYDQRILKAAQYKLQRIIGQKITINLLMKILKPRQ
jgi:hypothetical protein